MKAQKYEIVLRGDTGSSLSLDAAASCARIHPGIIDQLVEFGLIEPLHSELRTDLMFDVSVVHRLRTIQRLRRDLGINLAGVAVILDLLERIQALQNENEILRVRTG